jgi:succinoglycan biosynthesis protein ExoA
LAAVGGFDRRMTRNQDAELNLRLTGAGYTVWFDPQLAVAYTPRATVRGLARQYRDYGRWRRVTAARHRGSLRPRQLAAPTLVAGLTAATVLAAATRRAEVAALPAGAYAAGLLAAGAHATRGGPAGAARAAVALGTMHLSWGLGFWLGPPREARRADAGRPAP